MEFLKGLPKKVIEYNSRYYAPDGIVDPLDGWVVPEIQQKNFAYITRIVRYGGKPIQESSFLDIGCGHGRLYDYLEPFGPKRYVGIDINPDSLTQAILRLPTVPFYNRDLLVQPFREHFDYSVLSGSLTQNVRPLNNYLFMSQLLHRAWESTDQGLVFNYLPSTNNIPDAQSMLFFYDNGVVRTIAEQLKGPKKIHTLDMEVTDDRVAVTDQRLMYIVRE